MIGGKAPAGMPVLGERAARNFIQVAKVFKSANFADLEPIEA